MPIRIDWLDPNGGTQPVNIHRATSPMNDEANLPAPIGTVSGASFYVDDTAVRNQLYYYRLSSLGQAGTSDLIITPNKAMASMPYTGPGPQTLLRGDWECGFFGRLPMGSLITGQELISILGAGTDTAYADNEWLKFVYKGNIIFFPKYSIAASVSWDTVYKAGMVFGDIDPAQWPAIAKSNWGTITQKKRVQIGNHVLTIRNPTSRANPLNTGAVNPTDYVGGEWDQLIALTGKGRLYPDANGRGQFDDIVQPSMLGMTTDLSSSGVQVNRGWSDGVDSVNVSLSGTATHSQHGWRPMLILNL